MTTPQSEFATSHPAPAPLTSFVGRAREVAAVVGLLRDGVRLLTLTGPGGVGKTRLALAAASAAVSDFSDGGRFVPLAAMHDHALVASVLARAVGVRESSPIPFAEQVRAAAGETAALILIDNFEHLLPAGPLLTDLLAACPRLALLVTSRERLRLSGEHDLPVHPLPCPDPERLPAAAAVADFPAVRLFVERAQAIDPDFALTDANGAAVAAVCHRLDGLPLALELAAARSPHLTPAALLARLAYRLPLLTGGPRDVPARLRTMRNAIGWSHDLLAPAEQALFRRLAVFEGGFTLAAAEWVLGDGFRVLEESTDPSPRTQNPEPTVLDLIASLVDKSLVRRSEQPSADGSDRGSEHGPRFELLETIREFALERLVAAGEADELRSAHAAFYLGQVEAAAAPGVDESAALVRLEAEHANLRAALAWVCAHPSPAPDTALRLAARLGRFWLRRGHQREGRGWLERALAVAPDAAPELRSAALSARGDLLRDLGEHAAAGRSFERARDLARAVDDRHGEATALNGLSALTDDVSDHAATLALTAASAAIWRELGDHRGLARALHNQAWAEASLQQVAAATALLHEALGHARAAGDDPAVAHILGSLGNLLAEQGAFVAARPFLEEGLAVARAIEDEPETAELAADLGWLALELGDAALTRASLADCLALLRGSGRRRVAVVAIEACAVLAAIDGDQVRAARLAAAAAAIREEIGTPRTTDPYLTGDGDTAARRTLWRLDAALAPGPAWTLEEALREAAAAAAPPVAPGPPVSDPLRPSGLTPREVEVLRLVIAGRSDRAIADVLFISRRTASKHVAAILAKLGVATRAEAAAHAVRAGLA